MSRFVRILALISLVGLVAVLPASSSAGSGHEAAPGVGSGPEHHCSHPGGSASSGDAPDGAGDCCPDGCDACPSCTGGTAALICARIVGPHPLPARRDREPASSRDPSSPDAGGIYHPPRA